ncbi:type II/IV secretion system protein, partial [Candidatus Gracilibacteria bacterium]|nr:type II/IV secretion system protein [Candidatus Gracilibacteria bacterium]
MEKEKSSIQKTPETSLWTIVDEASLKSAIKVEKVRHPEETQNDRFQSLRDSIHASLERQDSEQALALITRGALGFGSSDIHYDVAEKDIKIRIRIDGELVDITLLSRSEYKILLERIKYKSDLKLNISEIPQDGKYRIADNDERIDVRVSTLPVRYGENVVCRILDSTQSIPKLEELGFIWTAKRQIDMSLRKKNGTILVTGPTGSGKTTTLYSMLAELNSAEKKIITLEDPIEYEIPGIVQSEVDEKKKYTFDTGLRALMRQDPDVIMIGEIRDLESATISMQAAMTGHLVLSTLHTKSAGETIERLLNMGVPGYILASGLDVIIAQRLVRRLCPHCIESYTAEPSQVEIIKYMLKDIGIAGAIAKKESYTLYRSHGCTACGMTGYKGRIGIYEVMNFTPEIRKLIRDGSSPKDIIEKARE